jgi:hypothetical protein
MFQPIRVIHQTQIYTGDGNQIPQIVTPVTENSLL